MLDYEPDEGFLLLQLLGNWEEVAFRLLDTPVLDLRRNVLSESQVGHPTELN